MLTSSPPLRLGLVGAACALSLLSAGCSSVNEMLAGDKVDYRTSGNKTVNLEVPPDLSQLSGQGRYTHANSGGTVSANTFNQQAQAAAPGSAPDTVAANSLGGVTLERDGQTRWLAVDRPPEQIWPLVRDFWVENGFELPVEQAQTGLMETNWSENRAKLQQGGLRQLVGKLLDNLYDTGERDQFRTRVERTPSGSEIYISHRGLQEVYVDARKDQTTWKARPSDPELEARMLSRLMVKLGASQESAQAAVAGTGTGATPAAATPPSSVRVLADGVTIALPGEFDQVWRRVGLALDRGGFTVEDRDRSTAIYEVRLAGSAASQANKPGLFSRMFNWFGDKPQADTLTRYRIKVNGPQAGEGTQAGQSTVTVLGSDNKPAATAAGREVARQLALNLE